MRIQGRFARLLLLVLFGGLGLVACSIPPPPARQPFRATDHFQGKALELAALADRHADGRLVSMLEGGYDLEALAECSVAHVDILRL